MIVTHSTVAHAAEWHMGRCQMHYRIIDAAAAIRHLFEHHGFSLLIFREVIQC